MSFIFAININVNLEYNGVQRLPCVLTDALIVLLFQVSCINVLHYLSSGEAKLEFILHREMFFMPLVMCLKALVDYTDRQIYHFLIQGREKDSYFSE